jgi:urease accessory protein
VILALTADERTRLRGLRHGRDRRAVLLQLPRGEALRPGEWLAAEDGLALARVAEPLALLQAAYHLGNRHVALEVGAGELRLLADPVLEDLLLQRGLEVNHGLEPFHPEPGAYGGAADHHSHSLPAAALALADDLSDGVHS